jgi:hypothetical protein
MRHRSRITDARRGRAFTVAAILALALAGCGSSSSSGNGVPAKSPPEIVAAARAAVAGAATVHVSGSIVSERKPISLDMELVAGKGGKGHISVQGLRVDLIAVEKAVYVNGSRSLYARLVGPAAASVLQGRWLKVPATSGSFASLSAVTDLTSLVDTTLANHGNLTSAPARVIDGKPAVGVTDPSRGGTLYVAATGEPYPLEISKSGTAGRIVFDRWNQSVTLTPPADPININELSGH